MPSLADILADDKTYPDDRKITLADGVETTLKELRSGHMMDRDYRQKTQALAREREAFAKEKGDFEVAKTDAEQQLARLAEQVITQGAPKRQQEAEWDAYLERDPMARRLVNEITSLKDGLKSADERYKKIEEDLKVQRQTYVADQHRAALARLKTSDPSLDEQALIQYAQQNYIPRLDLAYRLMTEDKRTKDAVTKAKEDAAKEGYEKAKRELAQPMLPQRRIVTSLPEDAPKTFDDAAERALRDPEILATLDGRTP